MSVNPGFAGSSQSPLCRAIKVAREYADRSALLRKCTLGAKIAMNTWVGHRRGSNAEDRQVRAERGDRRGVRVTGMAAARPPIACGARGGAGRAGDGGRGWRG